MRTLSNAGSQFIRNLNPQKHTSLFLVFFLLLFSFPIRTIAQQDSAIFQWASLYSGSDSLMNYATAIDANNDIYVSGNTRTYATGFDITTIKYNQNGDTLWVRTYNSPSNTDDYAVGIIFLSGTGDVYILGQTGNFLTSFDIVVVKYNTAGVLQWTHTYNSGIIANERPSAITSEANGTVFIAGYIAGTGNKGVGFLSDYLTFALDPQGNKIWEARYDNSGLQDAATGIVTDNNGNVIVTGWSMSSTGYSDFVTIKYDGSGNPLWTARYDGPMHLSDLAGALAVDGSGNIFVAGTINFDNKPSPFQHIDESDYGVIAYSPAGALLWEFTYDSDTLALEEASAIQVNSTGNIYVSGKVYHGVTTITEYHTISITPAGVLAWAQAEAIAPTFIREFLPRMALDSDGNIYVTGRTYNGTNGDALLVRYNPDGTRQWSQQYDGGSYDAGMDLAVDAQKNVYVTGYTFSSGIYQFLTVKYQQIVLQQKREYTWLLFSNGTVHSSGFFVKELRPLPELSNVASVDQGKTRGVALTNDGRVYTDGAVDHAGNASVLVSNIYCATDVAAGRTSTVPAQDFFLALNSDGTVVLWLQEETTATVVSGLSNIVDIAAGGGHALALTADGFVYGWGMNEYGQLGLGNTNSPVAVPTLIPNLSNVTLLAAGGQHSVAIRSDGTAWAFGRNNNGQLGNGLSGTGVDSDIPVIVIDQNGQPLTGIIDIACGENHSLALTSAGVVYGWGDNAFGQLLCPIGGIYDAAVSLPNMQNVIDVVAYSSGSEHSWAILSTGEVRLWGAADNGQLGLAPAIIILSNSCDIGPTSYPCSNTSPLPPFWDPSFYWEFYPDCPLWTGDECVPPCSIITNHIPDNLPSLTISSVQASDCSLDDGSATVTATGGTSPYAYQWDAFAGNQTALTAIGLGAGSYSVTVTDANGCIAAAAIDIFCGFPVTFSIVQPCGGVNNGQITVVPGGGTAPYNYFWSVNAGNQTGQLATGLYAGSYQVTVTDAIGGEAITLVNLIDGTTYDYSAGISVSSNASWNNWNVRIKGGLYINSGVTLTLNNSTLQFSEIGYNHPDYGEWGIIVDKGATLILNTCTLTSIPNCASMWDGIFVAGDGPGGSYATTGKVILNIGNVVENAHVAIESSPKTKLINQFPFPQILLLSDGVIRVFAGNKFINNRKHIVIDGLRWSASNFRINGSEFLCTGPLKDVVKYNNEGTSVFIELRNFEICNCQPLQRININGCNFNNTGSFSQSQRGTGIKSMNASFALQPHCFAYCLPSGECCIGSNTKNTIQNLSYGVYAYAANSLYNIIIKENQFTDNYRGVYLQNFYGATITRNDFDGFEYSGPGPYNIYLNGCTGYQVEENEILAQLPGYTDATHGIIVNNSGSGGDEIYNNQFHDIGVGVQPQGQTTLNSNEGLQIKCNDFTDNISFYHAAVTSGDIADPQGECVNVTSPAGNTFTHDCLFTGGDLASHALDGFVYNHHTDVITTPQCTTSTVIPNPCVTIGGYSKSTACPSHLGGGGNAGDVQMRIAGLTEQTAALKANYDSVLDGSNTLVRLQTIATKPAGQIKDELVLYSPYLSDTVLLAYLSKPTSGKGHVPPGHVKEVIIANSPVTQKVKTAVDNRSLPPGIQNEINVAQTGISARKELELQIAYFERQVAITRNELTRFYLNDTTNVAPLDSAIEVLKNSGTQTAEILLASAYIAAGDFTEARQQLNSLSLVPQLDNYVQIQNLVIDIFEAGAGFDTLITDSMLKQTVEAVADDTLKAGYLIARAIMSGVFGINYPEPIETLQLPSAKMGGNVIVPNEEQLNETVKEIYFDDTHYIKLYPNPAVNSVTVEYNITGSMAELEFVLYDITGRMAMLQELKGCKGKCAINLEGVENGLYFYLLKNDENILLQDKLIIAK